MVGGKNVPVHSDSMIPWRSQLSSGFKLSKPRQEADLLTDSYDNAQ